jgi:putative ABC transport system permease protein
MVSGFVPARRATRVEPVAAMRDSVTPGLGHLRRRRIVGAVGLMLAGLVALFVGLFGSVGSDSGAALLLGLGAVLMMFGVALIAPLLVRPLARALGAPLARWRGLTGVLARENAIRQPQRTAVTAAALMVGLALVVFVTIFAAGLKASVNKAIDDQVTASLIVQAQNGFTPIPNQTVDVVRRVPGVTGVSPARFTSGKVRGVGGNQAFTGVDPATIGAMLHLKWDQGSQATLRSLGSDHIVLDSDWAKSHHFKVGSVLHVTTPAGKVLPYTVSGTFKNQAGLTSNLIINQAVMPTQWDMKQLAFVAASARPGTDADKLAAVADRFLKPLPSTDALSIAQFQKKQDESVNQLLGLVFALLALSVIVALLGIVNTLALSVHERTRELGMLRAVGMSRKQVKRMIRGESVITAGIGSVLGTALGIVFAVIISRPLADQGFVFSLPVGTLILFFILAGIAGVLAAVSPARRAAKVDVLRAVTTE